MKNKDLISSLQQDAQTTPEPKVINIILKIIHIFIFIERKRVLEISSEIKEIKNQIKVNSKKKKVIMPINIIIKMKLFLEMKINIIIAIKNI